MERPVYYVPRISTKHGEDISGVYESLDAAVAVVADFCRSWWGDAANEWAAQERLDIDGNLPMPDTDDEVIEEYFFLVEDEAYEIHQALFYAKEA